MKRSSRESTQKKLNLYEVPAFDKKFRGYDRGAVDDYLNALVDAYNGMYAECQRLRSAAEEHALFREKAAQILFEKALAARPEPEGATDDRIAA